MWAHATPTASAPYRSPALKFPPLISASTPASASARARTHVGANLLEMVLAGPPAHVSSLTLILIDSHWYRLTCTSHVYSSIPSLAPSISSLSPSSLPPLCLSLARSRSLTHSHTLSVSLYPSLSLTLSLSFSLSPPLTHAHTHTQSWRARPQPALPTSGAYRHKGHAANIV
jgi:hypothetical protein